MQNTHASVCMTDHSFILPIIYCHLTIFYMCFELGTKPRSITPHLNDQEKDQNIALICISQANLCVSTKR